MSDLITVLLQMGFSFACSGVCMWYIYYSNKEHSKEMDATRKSHSEESKAFQKALTDMNVTLQRLADKIDEVLRDDLK